MTQTTTPSTPTGITVWVFNPADAAGPFPAGVWSSRDKAREWIDRVDAVGTLSAYILDEAAYDSNVRMGLLKIDGKPERATHEFMRRYTTAIDHEHFVVSEAYVVELGRDTKQRAQKVDPSTGKPTYQCVCCGDFNLSSVDACTVCEECGWEDWYECHDAPAESISPNSISLNLARSLVERFGPGACCEANWNGGVERARQNEQMPAEERSRLKTARQRVKGE